MKRSRVQPHCTGTRTGSGESPAKSTHRLPSTVLPISRVRLGVPMLRLGRHASLACALALLASCSSLVGLDDLEPDDADAGAAGRVIEPMTGGTKNEGGTAGSGEEGGAGAEGRRVKPARTAEAHRTAARRAAVAPREPQARAARRAAVAPAAS